jgi:2-polyprenyl-3-methyl-5-hydroxy-6-metoxy-1,4-benzoquinol methylase
MDCRRDIVYQNEGNPLLLSLLSRQAQSILDIGCGAGDNARLIRSMSSDWQPEIVGITLSSEEASIARRLMTEVHVADLETSDFVFLENRQFDAIIFSYVLEHLAYPVRVLSKLIKYLRESGQVLIAVPNIMECRNRFRLLRGYFEYQECGIMDRTHLRFSLGILRIVTS